MKLIEYGETESIINECSKIRQLVKAIRPSMDFIEKRLDAIERQCRIWEFRLAYQNRGEQDED